MPCGVAKGCDTVALHPSAWISGDPIKGGITVAYVGFAGYLFLTALAVFRAMRNQESSKALNVVGFLVSGVGALYSGYLTYTALTIIKATCLWCIASAIVMVITAVVAAALTQADKGAEKSGAKFDLLLAGVLSLSVVGALFGGFTYLKSKGEALVGGVDLRVNKDKIELVGPDDHVLGNADAPVTIVEFADMLCPTCQQTFPILEELVKKSNGNVRLVFHHFPLFMKEDHKMALPAATIAEIAADDNKFWQFLAAIYSKSQVDLQSTEAILGVAKSVGLDADKISKRLENPEDPAIKRVTDDLNLANQIKITGTPTILIQAKGGEFEQVMARDLEAKLNTEPYKSLIQGGAAAK